MFEKILIADRGEIALRIARTCERMGIASVALHTPAEAGAPYVTGCDSAIALESARETDALLDVPAVIAAAQRCGAQAIHPGYGALCRDPNMARAATEAGIALVGASAEALERFADRLQSRELASFAGVRPLPSAKGDPVSAEVALEVGYPLCVRAVAGRGVREVADSEDELPDAVERGRARARAAFGDERVYMERWLDRPRVLSVQVVSDGRECIALGDLERSLEQRTRMLLAESPAPALTSVPGGDQKRRMMCDAATRVAADGGLVGAASADFLLDAEGKLYFACMRPGLPREHVLSEMCAHIDLVEIQIRIAAGERMPAEALRAQPTGNAVEGRIYAEDADSGVVSDPTELTALRWPMVAPGALRVETDLAVGGRVATDLDPLVAKVTAYGQTRHQALLTLDRVLAEATIEPLATNLPFVREILADEAYRAGQYDTGFAERLQAELKTRT